MQVANGQSVAHILAEARALLSGAAA